MDKPHLIYQYGTVNYVTIVFKSWKKVYYYISDRIILTFNLITDQYLVYLTLSVLNCDIMSIVITITKILFFSNKYVYTNIRSIANYVRNLIVNTKTFFFPLY